MTALTANMTAIPQRLDVRGLSNGALRSLPVETAANTIFNGSAVARGWFTELLAPIGQGYNAASLAAWSIFAGISEQEVTYGASSGSYHSVNVSGPVVKNVAVAGVTSGAQVNKTVYLSTDNWKTDLTLTWTVMAVPVGVIFDYRSTGYADVQFFTPEEAAIAAGVQPDGTMIRKLLSVTLSAESTGNVTGGADLLTFGGAGTISEFWAEVTTPTTDNDADATFNVEIDTTNTTGGVITLGDTADQTTPTSTDSGRAAIMGAKIMGSKITAANTFTAGQTLSVECVVSNAYSNGVIDLYARFTK